MNSIIIHNIKTTFGEMVIGEYQNQICLVDWKHRKMRQQLDKKIASLVQAQFELGHTPLIQETENQLHEFCAGTRKEFNLPTLLVGTSFQKKVWEALLRIPYGQTTTYKSIAETVASESSIRAVAGAIGANSLAFVVPCHRVVGSKGELTGYAGGLNIKKRVLTMENGTAQSQLEF